MLEESLREFLSQKIVKILEGVTSREIAIEIEKKMSYEDRKKILREYERNGKLSEETTNYLFSKFYFKDVTGVLFGIPSEIVIYPEITQKMVGSGKFGLEGLRKHIRELGYPESKFEDVLLAIYGEIRKRSADPRYEELFAVACLEIGTFYLDRDYKRAEDFLLEAYALRSKLETQRAIKLVEAIKKLGGTYSRLKKTDKAEFLLEKAFEIAKDLKDKSLISEQDFARLFPEDYKSKTSKF